VEEQSSTVDIRDLIWRVRKNIGLLALPAVVVLCGAVLYLRFAPKKYVSSMVVSIGDRVSLANSMDPLIRTDENREQPEAMAAAIQSRIFSRPFLTEVGERLGWNRDPRLLAKARKVTTNFTGITPEEYASRLMVQEISTKISVSGIQGSLVRISASDETPKIALQLAGSVGDILVDRSRRSTVKAAQQRTEFSSDQVSVYEERLRKSEAALRDFQESMIGRHISSNVVREQNVDEARMLASETDEEIQQARGRIESGRTQWQSTGGGPSLPTLGSQAATALEARLAQLEINLATTSLETASSTSNALTASKSKIVETRQALYSEYQSIAQSNLKGQADDAAGIAASVALDRSILKSLRAKKDRLDAMIQDYVRGVAASPRNQIELERLQADVATNRDLLLSLKKEATSSRISEALGVTQLGIPVEIVEPAMLPLYPASPDRMKILGAALILGPLLSIGLLMGMERLSAVVKTAEQAEAELGAPVIGTIPLVTGWRKPGSAMSHYWPVMVITLVLLLTGAAYVARNALTSMGHSSTTSSTTNP